MSSKGGDAVSGDDRSTKATVFGAFSVGGNGNTQTGGTAGASSLPDGTPTITPGNIGQAVPWVPLAIGGGVAALAVVMLLLKKRR